MPFSTKKICDSRLVFDHLSLLKMKAMQVNNSTEGPALIATELPQPRPGEGKLLISVCAAGVTPTELRWYPTSHT
jgi:hypothetical protein